MDDDGGADYTRIQNAIDNASEGDTIYVFSGFYNEKINLDKPITLQGENKTTTILDGTNISNILLEISSNESMLSGFRIQNGDISINLANAHHNIITDNILWNNRPEGFKIYCSNNNIITDNIIYNAGLILEESTGNTIENNLFESQGITITYNLASEKDHWNSHTIRNNSIDGKPIRYYTNNQNIEVPCNSGQVILANCHSFTLQNLNISEINNGIQIGYSSNNIIRGNKIIDSDLMIAQSSENTIMQNNFSDSFNGIYLILSNDNSITQNTIENNRIGALMEYSSGNTITKNDIRDNKNSGLIIVYSLGNIIKNNNFIKNDIHARFSNSIIDILLNSIINYYVGSIKNKWSYNYWDDWSKNFPKPIQGTFDYLYMAQLPTIKFDWHPAQQPFDINI